MHFCPSRKARSQIAIAVVAALAAAPAARAQEAGATSGGLEEIIVTAQKREQRLQDVPIAMSVVGEELLRGVTGLTVESLETLVPALNLRKTNTPLNQSLLMRGVGTITFAIAAQPSVAFVLDGVVMASGGEAFGDLYDVERVEVLRGPQGTLFGKNSSAGVINVVTKRPGDEIGGYVELGYFEDDEMQAKASVDLPISERLHTRTTVSWGDFDGYIDNVTNARVDETLNGYDRWGIRSVWVADPTDDVQLTIIGDYREADDDCCTELLGDRFTGATAAGLNAVLAGTDIGKGADSRKVRQDFPMRAEEEAWGLSLQADVGFGDHMLTSITAYRSWDSTEYREGDWRDSVPYVGNAFMQQHDVGPQALDTLSQELRMASPGGEFVDWVAGLYYSKTEAERDFTRNDTVCTSSTLAIDATGQRPCTAADSVYTSSSASANFGSDFENYAVFADGTFNVTDRLRFLAGLRWTHDEVDYFHTYNFAPAVTGGPQPGLRDVTDPECTVNGVVCDSRTIKGASDSDEMSGRAGAQFAFTDNLMAYAMYARGYKGPAYNVFFNMRLRDTPVLDPETADSYEIGLKSTFADGRVLLNLAAFDAQYDNYQTNSFIFLGGTRITTLVNAGSVETSGVELDFQARPFDDLSINGGVAYTKAEVDKFPVPSTAPPGTAPIARSGTALPLAPVWKGFLAANYTFEFDAFDLVPGLVWSYTDEQWGDVDESDAVRMPSYTNVDLSVALQDRSDRYRVTLFARNVTDESFTVLKTGASGSPTTSGSARYQIPRDAERYFGVQARFNFGGAR
jgi:iron complex outermembrane receptor protein